MISGAHVILFSKDAEADRDFFKNVLKFPHVDAGEGWLIFALPPAELAVHPTEGKGSHELYLSATISVRPWHGSRRRESSARPPRTRGGAPFPR